MLEIEIKVRVPDLVPVRERILLGHAGTPVKVHERDIYYNAPHRDFGITDEALRLRYAGGSCTLTYKGKKKIGVPAQSPRRADLRGGSR